MLGLTGSSPRPLRVSRAEVVAQITGEDSPNHTDRRFGITAADLGITWETGRGHVLVAFGDTYGAGWTGPGGGIGDEKTLDWRSNALLRSSDRNLAAGMTFDSAAIDHRGHAKELLPSLKNEDAGEITVIPTAGVCVGSRQYLAYMSVRHWGDPGHWDTNLAGIAFSDDDGESWRIEGDAQWPNVDGNDPFQMGAFTAAGRYVYLFGTPNGRFGDAHVARVSTGSILDAAGYEYWTGSRWRRGETSIAAPIVTGPVGELSVRYDPLAHTWLMTYLNEHDAAIVLRHSSAPQGPWSTEQVLASAEDFPALYGGFMHPWSSGRELYFLMSQWSPYNVFLMRCTLSR